LTLVKSTWADAASYTVYTLNHVLCKADDYTGYVVDVKYEGYAKYPEYKIADSYRNKGLSYPAMKYKPKDEPKYAAL
jgi:hypothetical protein